MRKMPCTWIEFLVIGAMPFLYGAATRLPFIYFVIHLVGHFELGWWTVGLYVAAYQGCRVVTSSVSIVTPKLSHFLGTAAGLSGYITVFVSDKDRILPFVIGTAVVGLSETMSSMQKYAKDMYKFDPNHKKAQMMLRYQYASVMIGVMFAFSIGGVVYQHFSINGVAMFGIIVEGFGLLSLLAYLALHQELVDNRQEQTEESILDGRKGDDMDTSGKTSVMSLDVEQEGTKKPSRRSAEGLFLDEEEPLDSNNKKEGDEENTTEKSTTHNEEENEENEDEIIRKLSQLIDSTHADHATSDVPATWVNWLLCLSFGIEALTIGYNLSIGPIFVLNQFEKGTGIIGLLFAVGAASGTIAAIGVTCTTFGKKLMKSVAEKPFDLCFAMGGIAVGVLVAAIPNFVAHVIGLILLMCFNDLGATLMTELQGSITTVSVYSLIGPLGQVVRRSLNVVTALTGPVLFGIYPRLPYFVAGVTTLLWTVMLTIAFKLRMKHTVKAIARKTLTKKESVKCLRLSFTTAEVARSVAKLGETAGDDV